jgi:hypothetical protein
MLGDPNVLFQHAPDGAGSIAMRLMRCGCMQTLLQKWNADYRIWDSHSGGCNECLCGQWRRGGQFKVDRFSEQHDAPPSSVLGSTSIKKPTCLLPFTATSIDIQRTTRYYIQERKHFQNVNSHMHFVRIAVPLQCSILYYSECTCTYVELPWERRADNGQVMSAVWCCTIRNGRSTLSPRLDTGRDCLLFPYPYSQSTNLLLCRPNKMYGARNNETHQTMPTS